MLAEHVTLRHANPAARCLPLRLVDPPPSSSLSYLLLPFDTVNICATRFLIPRFSAVLYSHAKHPVSEYVVSCKKHLSVSSRVFRLFCPLSSHYLLESTAISPFTIPKWAFLNMRASNHHFIQDLTSYLFTDSEPTVAVCMCIPHGRQI